MEERRGSGRNLPPRSPAQNARAKNSHQKRPRKPSRLKLTPLSTEVRRGRGRGCRVVSRLAGAPARRPKGGAEQKGGRNLPKEGVDREKGVGLSSARKGFVVGSQRFCRRLAKVLSSARKGFVVGSKGFVVCSRRFGVCSSRSVSQSAGSSGSTCPRRLGRETRQRRLCGGPAHLDGELVETRRSSELRSREEDSSAPREVATPFSCHWGFCVNDCGRRLSVEVELS